MTSSTTLVSDVLQTERLSDGRRRLLRDLVVDVEGERITVPTGTTTDFSSIPWFGRVLVRWSKVDIAGVVHDWLYQTGQIPRWRADKIWRLVAIAGKHHATRLQAWICWLFLRLVGLWAWYQHRSNDPQEAENLAS